MVTRYGMSENVGVICYDDDDEKCSSDVIWRMHQRPQRGGEQEDRWEISVSSDECHAKCRALILRILSVLHKCAPFFSKRKRSS